MSADPFDTMPVAQKHSAGQLLPPVAHPHEDPTTFAAADVRVREYARSRDPKMREQLILRHQHLVRYIAGRFVGRGETLEDLVQVANIGLIKALDRYDPNRPVTFATFATPTMVGEIKRHFRDKCWRVKVARRLQERFLQSRRAENLLTALLGRTPTVSEIAERIGATEEETLEAMEVCTLASPVSLDRRLNSDSDPDGVCLGDVIGYIDSGLERVERADALRTAMEHLDERERRVIRLRFFEENSQALVSNQMGISQMHVSRLEKRALTRLRQLLSAEPSPSYSLPVAVTT